MRKPLGFALSEVMIGTAFATVFAVAGYPSYMDQVLKSRRAEAQALLVAIAEKQERVRAEKAVYAPDLASLGLEIPPALARDYDITMSVGKGPVPTFSIVATAAGGQRQDKCSFLGMNQDGVRLPFGCW